MVIMETQYITIRIATENGRNSPKVKNHLLNWKEQPMHIILEMMTKTTTRNRVIFSALSKQMEKPMYSFGIPQHRWVVRRNLYRSATSATAIRQTLNTVKA